jgi:hypothetical protein
MQGIWVFASTAARNAAVTSPQEGNFAFTKDTNSLWYYDGAAWVASGATGDIEGVTAGTGISGGGTSGTVTITNSMATEIAAKADLIVGTGSATFDNLTVGANGTVLTADSTVSPTGLKWATPAASGGMTLLDTVSLSGASTTSNTFSSSYKQILVYLTGVYASSDSTSRIRLNGDTASNYTWTILDASTSVTPDTNGGTTFMPIGYHGTSSTALKTMNGLFTITRPTDTTVVFINSEMLGSRATSQIWASVNGVYDNSAVITSITFLTSAGTYTAGTAYIYGVN